MDKHPPEQVLLLHFWVGTNSAKLAAMRFSRIRLNTWLLTGVIAVFPHAAEAQTASAPPAESPKPTLIGSEPAVTVRESAAQPGTVSDTQPPATPNYNVIGNLGLLLALPENFDPKPNQSATWGGFELSLLTGNRFAQLGGAFSFGWGGTQSVVVNLAPCVELGTPLSARWPSLHVTGAAGVGLMSTSTDEDSTTETEDRQADGRAFVSYGAILRIPVFTGKTPHDSTLSLYFSARREHIHWFDSAVASNFDKQLAVFGMGLSLHDFD
jgi:hypothetical protein